MKYSEVQGKDAHEFKELIDLIAPICNQFSNEVTLGVAMNLSCQMALFHGETEEGFLKYAKDNYILISQDKRINPKGTK